MSVSAWLGIPLFLIVGFIFGSIMVVFVSWVVEKGPRPVMAYFDWLNRIIDKVTGRTP